ncbi:TPA: HTH domain-containing protein, partial [Yersinia enterocolitica]|nr:HTH domain-containing protein [Yersinia enterocolitica]
VENSSSLSLMAERILAIIAVNHNITMVKIAGELKVSSRTIERNIKILQEKGRLVRVGTTKSGYWRVI